MRRKIEEVVQIPEGVSCTYADGVISCTKEGATLNRKIQIPEVEIKVDAGNVKFTCQRGNKLHYKKIKTNISHLNNLFDGLNEKYSYHLEVCHVHFPITVKVEGNKVIVSNFFGEKKVRSAEILPNVEVDIKGQNITVTSHDKEAAGQTAANLEKATKLKGRDRRIYQDGIHITAKPGQHQNA